jgi:hypothetical protein
MYTRHHCLECEKCGKVFALDLAPHIAKSITCCGKTLVSVSCFPQARPPILVEDWDVEMWVKWTAKQIKHQYRLDECNQILDERKRKASRE